MRGSRPRSLHVVVVDNTSKFVNASDARFFPQIIDTLHSYAVSGLVGRITCIRSFEEFARLKVSVDRVILSGSATHVHELRKNDPRWIIVQHLVKPSTNIPVLGICFGAQLINDMFGGDLYEMGRSMCKPRLVRFRPELRRVEKYQFCLKFLPRKIGESLRVKARLASGGDASVPVAFSHANAPVHGVLFHPEADRSGRNILRTFVESGHLPF